MRTGGLYHEIRSRSHAFVTNGACVTIPFHERYAMARRRPAGGASAATIVGGVSLAQTAAPRIEITIAPDARAEATTGMVYVAISRDNKRTPIEQAAPTGAPLFSIAVDSLQSGTPVAHHGRASAAIRSRACATCPAGEYWVQPFVNVYTRFARADGKTVWLHMDQWEGQNWKRSPGNLYGEPVQDAVRSASHRRRSA